MGCAIGSVDMYVEPDFKSMTNGKLTKDTWNKAGTGALSKRKSSSSIAVGKFARANGSLSAGQEL